MSYIRKFLESHQDNSEFDLLKRHTIDSLKRALEEYEDFTNDISPSFWRTTGTHITALRGMIYDIERFTPMTKEESELDWVKQQRFK